MSPKHKQPKKKIFVYRGKSESRFAPKLPTQLTESNSKFFTDHALSNKYKSGLVMAHNNALPTTHRKSS